MLKTFLELYSIKVHRKSIYSYVTAITIAIMNSCENDRRVCYLSKDLIRSDLIRFERE